MLCKGWNRQRPAYFTVKWKYPRKTVSTLERYLMLSLVIHLSVKDLAKRLQYPENGNGHHHHQHNHHKQQHNQHHHHHGLG
jgi:hypothetical protein